MTILCLSSTAMRHHLLFCSFLLLLSCYVSSASVYGAEEARDGFHTTPISALLPKDRCSAPAAGVSRGLPITPRYGPCSKQPGRSQPPSRHQEISGLNEPRIGSIPPKFNPGAPRDMNRHRQLFEDDGNFLVDVGFGTPQQNFSLLMDTGSSLTWTQCKSCVNCLDGASHFDRWASATYSFGSCIPSTGADGYSMLYGDKSSSTGDYGCDTLTLEPSDVFPKFQFGCGRDNRGDFGKGVDGILGLGQGRLSLLSQTASKYKNVFSYCLPADSIGSLLFGDEALSQSSSLQFTPLRPGSSSDHYFVNLLGISVANKRLNIRSSLFASPGTIIDSGTIITRLPQLAYSALKAAFKEAMARYPPSNKRPEPGDILDTCYDLSGNKVVLLPQIVLHFDRGANVVLNENRVLWGDNPSHVCLAFAESTGNPRYTIIGNRQQLSLTVLYDLEGGRIGFGNCAQ